MLNAKGPPGPCADIWRGDNVADCLIPPTPGLMVGARCRGACCQPRGLVDAAIVFSCGRRGCGRRSAFVCGGRVRGCVRVIVLGCDLWLWLLCFLWWLCSLLLDSMFLCCWSNLRCVFFGVDGLVFRVLLRVVIGVVDVSFLAVLVFASWSGLCVGFV